MDSKALKSSLDALAAIEPAFAPVLSEIGYPGPRVRERGHRTLVQAIISQQVSIKAAAAILAKVEAATGGIADPENIARTSDEQLRAAGVELIGKPARVSGHAAKGARLHHLTPGRWRPPQEAHDRGCP